jgi:hypothetical protein
VGTVSWKLNKIPKKRNACSKHLNYVETMIQGRFVAVKGGRRWAAGGIWSAWSAARSVSCVEVNITLFICIVKTYILTEL